MAEKVNKRHVTYSTELLDVGKKSSTLDTLLVTRSKPERLPPSCDTLLVTRSKPERLPPSCALSAVKKFLPQLQAANQALQERMTSEPVENLDIENVEGYNGPIIEMNIALQENMGDSSESETDLSSSDGNSSEDGLMDELSIDNIKLPSSKTCKRKKHVIEELAREQNEEKNPSQLP